jgi:cytoskeletal protein RodZ
LFFRNGGKASSLARFVHPYLQSQIDILIREKSMNRSQRICLSLVCALVLVLLPLSYRMWAQSYPSTQQPAQQQEQTNSNQMNQNQDMNNQTQTQDSTSQSQDREKSSDQKDSSQTNSGMNQDKTTGQSQSDQNMTREKPSTPSQATPSTTQNENESKTDQSETNKEQMPRTAGELPLIALIGLLSLGAATGTRVLSRAKSR